MVAVSVLLVTSDPGPALSEFMRAVDAQTLPAQAFELIVVDGSGDGSHERLRQLAERRPNVVVLSPDAGSAAQDRLALAAMRAEGEYVLVVTGERRLAPRALELLLGQAHRTGADVVLGRVVTRAVSGSAVLGDDSDRIDVSGIDPTDLLAMVRRPLLSAGAGAGALLLDLATLLHEVEAVSAVGRYACAIAESASEPASSNGLLTPPSCSWEEGMLRLAVGMRLPGRLPPPVRACLVLTRGPAEVAIPATIRWGDGETASGTVSATLDPALAESGHPLEQGSWDLRIRLMWPSREQTLPLGPGPIRSAVVRGRPYVIGAADGLAHLDVGATLTSVVGLVSETDATVAESEHGALATLAYGAVHVHGDAVLPGRLLLGTFGVPARLTCRAGQARLEAYVGGLPGTNDVAVVVGGGKPVPTGLVLRVGSTGAMVLEERPVTEPDAPRIPAADPAPLVQRLRRRLPGRVDPLVQRLAGVPALRTLYRRLINR